MWTGDLTWRLRIFTTMRHRIGWRSPLKGPSACSVKHVIKNISSVCTTKAIWIIMDSAGEKDHQYSYCFGRQTHETTFIISNNDLSAFQQFDTFPKKHPISESYLFNMFKTDMYNIFHETFYFLVWQNFYITVISLRYRYAWYYSLHCGYHFGKRGTGINYGFNIIHNLNLPSPSIQFFTTDAIFERSYGRCTSNLMLLCQCSSRMWIIMIYWISTCSS